VAGPEVRRVEVALGFGEGELVGNVGEPGDHHPRGDHRRDVGAVVTQHSQSLTDVLSGSPSSSYSESSPAVARLSPLTTRSTSSRRDSPGVPNSIARRPSTTGNATAAP
jgi:hypothetical protein